MSYRQEEHSYIDFKLIQNFYGENFNRALLGFLEKNEIERVNYELNSEQ